MTGIELHTREHYGSIMEFGKACLEVKNVCKVKGQFAYILKKNNIRYQDARYAMLKAQSGCKTKDHTNNTPRANLLTFPTPVN